MATQSEEIDQIIQKVLSYESSYQPLFSRMDIDFAKYWLLEEFTPKAEEGVSQDDAYTTNRPRVLAETVHNAIAMSEVIIRVDNDESKENGRKVNDAYESIAIGWLNNANNWRLDGGNQMGRPTRILRRSTRATLYLKAGTGESSGLRSLPAEADRKSDLSIRITSSRIPKRTMATTKKRSLTISLLRAARARRPANI